MNLILVLCVNSVLFVVRGLHVGHSRHGEHVDHVNDLAEVLLHDEVVKNPDLVRFCDHVNREIRTIKVLGEFL